MEYNGIRCTRCLNGGMCKLTNTHLIGRQVQICNRQNIAPLKRLVYLAKWANKPELEPLFNYHTMGSELIKLIDELGMDIFDEQCIKIAQQLNTHNMEWIRENTHSIVNILKEVADSRGIPYSPKLYTAIVRLARIRSNRYGG